MTKTDFALVILLMLIAIIFFEFVLGVFPESHDE